MLYRALRRHKLLPPAARCRWLSSSSAATSPLPPPNTTTHLLQAMACPSRGQNIALVDQQLKKTYTYRQICEASLKLASTLQSSGRDIKCIASYNKPGANYVITALAAWHLGATLVPLCVAHTPPEISYFVADSGSDVLVHEPDGETGVQHLSVPKVCINDADIWKTSSPSCPSPEFNIPDPSASALILYTSGTSGSPKGCVHTHDGLSHMIASLVDAWEYSANDKILHFLPLHHLHGVLNKLWCTLYAGGEVEFMPSADARAIWRRLAAVSTDADKETASAYTRPPTIFMAVPTIYSRLLEAASTATATDAAASNSIGSGSALTSAEVAAGVSAVKAMRVTISGSAALPDPVMAAWRALTGHDLLERYGMSEIGMALSNPLHGRRVPGSVGSPLAFLQARLVDDSEEEVTAVSESGELRFKGPTIFKYYLNKDEETKKTFDENGWFKTGDIAVREHPFSDSDEVRYRILGRSSTDIIKSGGYKLSALEIERELLSHPEVGEVAVVGQADDMYGEIVTAIVVIRQSKEGTRSGGDNLAAELKEFLKSRMALYKQPRKYHVVDALPRNLMGKINKKTLLKDLKLVAAK